MIMFGKFYKFNRGMKRLFLTFYAVLFNTQTGLLLLLLGGFWLLGTVYCSFFLPDKTCWQWSFWHLFDISELRQTLAAGPWHARLAGSILYVFTWVLGCGVLITILIDEKMKWMKKYNLGLYHSKTNRRNHIVILGWDEMACSLIRELLNSNQYRKVRIRKIIILSSVSAEEIRKQLLRYGIDTDAIPTAIDPWNGEFDSEPYLRSLRIEAAQAVYILGEPDELGHDHRVLTTLDFLKKYLTEKLNVLKGDNSFPCYTLINQYSLYWNMIREIRARDTKDVIQPIPINFHENWCKLIWCSLAESGVGKYPHLCSNFNSDQDVALVIAGFSAMGQTMLIEALRIAHFVGNRKTEILIIDPKADRLWRDFLAAHPGSDAIPDVKFLSPVNASVASDLALDAMLGLQKSRQLTVALTYRNTDKALNDAIVLKNKLEDKVTLLVRQDSSVIHSLNSGTGNLTIYDWKNVFFFGRRCDSAYNPWHRELMAKELHRKYLVSLEENVKKKDSQLVWDSLEEKYHWKYRYQIDVLPEMFHSIGIEIKPLEEVPERERIRVWSESELPQLSECSHNRWWADRILEGWRYGETYDKNDKTAPNMRPYSELEEKKDFIFIQTIPDTLAVIGYCLRRIRQDEDK